ncbi:MAG: hypothetical protein EOO65_00510 [Methanosarcinales archaeon]|nr:MAG: hypothetical protein EOO65_00510 [Methanosarcinales archaeon]
MRAPHTYLPVLSCCHCAATCPSVASLPVLSSKHNVSRAVDAIRRGLVTQTEVGDLQLPSGTWPAATNNTLFVRSFYDALYTNVLRECKMKQSSGVTDDDRRIITGQPGIGKSVFGFV